MAHAVDIGRKLELTATATGCLTRKELCAVFARVNPNTLLTLQNSYNWIRGRSKPRSFSLYEDWAEVLQLSEGPHFIMSSSFEEFARVLSERFQLPHALLKSQGIELGRQMPSPERRAPGVGGAWAHEALIEGSFLALSPAWSPTQTGRLLLGAARFAGGGDSCRLRYLEKILGERVAFEGPCQLNGRSGQAVLRCSANEASFFMSFHLPAVPGNLTGGVFAGNAIYDPEAQPSASPILFLRNHALDETILERLLGYHPLEADSLARSLKALGYGCTGDQAAEEALLCLLRQDKGGASLKLERAAIIEAAALLDERRLLTLKEEGLGQQPSSRQEASA
ncbi:MAG TPA: hypothetical protein VKY54_13960 [Kiloniellales bacterium]|nr:hypothetical protein [Kiloniellales bacterium]